MVNFIQFPDEVLLNILQYLDTWDRIALAYVCSRFKRICMDPAIINKLNLSTYAGTQQIAIREFFRDKQMAQHIRELNLSNNPYFINWQIDVDLEEFIIASCPHLEALHVLQCGLSLKSLHRILQHKNKLTALSFSLSDLSSEDNTVIEHICLENIKNLHFEIPFTEKHLDLVHYLVLSHCKCLEELHIYMWDILYMAASKYDMISIPAYKPSKSIRDTFQHLHSLVMIRVLGKHSGDRYIEKLHTFVHHLVLKKSRGTKWKRFWISPPLDSEVIMDIYLTYAFPFNMDVSHEFDLVEAFSAHYNLIMEDELEMLFQRINDSTVRYVQLRGLNNAPSMVLFLESIARIGGDALRHFSLSAKMNPEANFVLNTFVSACANIRELDFIGCHFETNICKTLSKLKSLVKIQLQQCAVTPNLTEKQPNEGNAKLWTLVENCQSVMEFDIRGCDHECSHFIIDDDLLSLTRWTKLKSFTCYKVKNIKQCMFLGMISEHCKFLEMMRISIKECGNECYISIFDSFKFLKHLAVEVPYVDFGLEDFWTLLSSATNLQRLCITSHFGQSLNVPGAVEMLRNLPQLHVLHLHFLSDVENIEDFREQIVKTFEEEASNHISFEFLLDKMKKDDCWIYEKVLPINIIELCYKTPSMAVPTFLNSSDI